MKQAEEAIPHPRRSWGKNLIQQIRSILVALAAVILLAGVAYGLYRYSFSIKYKQAGGIKRIVICSECKHKEERKIVDIGKSKCNACQNTKLSYVTFCPKCCMVFPFKKDFNSKKKLTKEETLLRIQSYNRCPRCKFLKTEVVLEKPTLDNLIKEFNSREKKQKKQP